MMTSNARAQHSRRGGFTLIELLVVVAIIALLISILLPSLGAARKQARAAKCGAHMRSIGQAVQAYLVNNKDAFPASYQYLNANGKVTLDGTKDGGYLHWSYALFSNGQVSEESFTCPEIPNGGAPRTNPGPEGKDWEAGEQIDDGGSIDPAPTNVRDRQAARMAFTANAAVMPRNKFNTTLSAGVRVNQYVKANKVRQPSDTILAAEFTRNWKTTAKASGNYFLSKSHRPVNPFVNVGGTDEYSLPTQAFFRYMLNDENFGIKSVEDLNQFGGQIDDPGYSDLNTVGRHHPGGDKLGGTANFLFVDGHVDRKPVRETMVDREWGERYYSITGNNEVVDRYGQARDGG